MPYLFLLFISLFTISACTNTQPKVVASNDINATTPPNLTGLWVLNRELSQAPQELIKENRRKNRNTKGNKSMTGRGNGDHKGKGNRQAENGSKNKINSFKQGFLPQSFQALLKSSETLNLKHKEPLLTIITPHSQEEVYTDFRSTNVSSNKDPNQTITIAGWEDNILIVESTISAGRFIQKFNLKTAAQQLWVNTEILTPHLQKPIKFNRVYEMMKTEKK